MKERVILVGVFVFIGIFFMALFGCFGEGIQMGLCETIKELSSHRVFIYNR